MLREDAEAAQQDIEPLDRVLGAGRHLLASINDILDLSKIEAGRMELHLASFALASLIDDVVKTIEPPAAAAPPGTAAAASWGSQKQRRPDDGGRTDAVGVARWEARYRFAANGSGTAADPVFTLILCRFRGGNFETRQRSRTFRYMFTLMEEFMNKLLLTSIAALSLAAAPAVAQQGKSMQQPQATMQQHNGSQAQNENRANASANLNQDEIRQAQQALNQKGFNVGRPDGLMGPKTENAIKEFQQKQGLNATGQLDDQTLAALGVSASTNGQNTGQSSQQRGNPQSTAK